MYYFKYDLPSAIGCSVWVIQVEPILSTALPIAQTKKQARLVVMA